MNNPRIRGLIFLAVGGVLAWFLCVFLPFTALPSAGLSIAMPVITVPGEIVVYKWIGDFDLPNTLLGGLLASALVIIWVVLNYQSTKGWTREIPDRWQAWTEMFVEAFYNFCAGLGGEKFKKAPLLWPLVAAIFIFLLAANWGKLLPGVESVGYVHCAYPGFKGYARIQGMGDSWRLWVDRSLFAGHAQTEQTEADCQHQLKVTGTYYGEYDPADYEEERAAFYARLEAIGGTVPEEYAGSASTSYDEVTLTANRRVEATPAVEEEAPVVPNEPATGLCLATNVAAVAPVAEETEGEEAAPAAEGESHSSTPSSIALMSLRAAEEAPHSVETVSSEAIAVAYAELQDLEAAFANGEVSALALEQKQCEVTQMLHPAAIFPMSAAELQANKIQPYVFTLAPFFRGVSTDLSFNVGLAVLAILAVQVYGVMAQGPAYFEKFLNLSAIGNAGKRPLGIIDFVVGIIEIVSELGKIVSLSFRLFGNIFAGGIVLVIFSFLIAFLLPGIMLLLEVIIGMVQALVFAVLTLVFAVQAMEAHHGDDHDEHH